jgi:hypothetical protein
MSEEKDGEEMRDLLNDLLTISSVCCSSHHSFLSHLLSSFFLFPSHISTFSMG